MVDLLTGDLYRLPGPLSTAPQFERASSRSRMRVPGAIGSDKGNPGPSIYRAFGSRKRAECSVRSERPKDSGVAVS